MVNNNNECYQAAGLRMSIAFAILIYEDYSITMYRISPSKSIDYRIRVWLYWYKCQFQRGYRNCKTWLRYMSSHECNRHCEALCQVHTYIIIVNNDININGIKGRQYNEHAVNIQCLNHRDEFDTVWNQMSEKQVLCREQKLSLPS